MTLASVLTTTSSKLLQDRSQPHPANIASDKPAAACHISKAAELSPNCPRQHEPNPTASSNRAKEQTITELSTIVIGAVAQEDRGEERAAPGLDFEEMFADPALAAISHKASEEDGETRAALTGGTLKAVGGWEEIAG
ncbi:hypothetical protein Nepgr_018778 [Nepenthes gracilis]|uniref:Uncharacterized protein n=1 Tax=Nepenthes gracilis TaxID=150966 RepID=A0AAD3SUR9_NEPGR|nr:hypothetical protein Nepgr_018778 [Nepenthes gracilis]